MACPTHAAHLIEDILHRLNTCKSPICPMNAGKVSLAGLQPNPGYEKEVQKKSAACKKGRSLVMRGKCHEAAA